VDMRS